MLALFVGIQVVGVYQSDFGIHCLLLLDRSNVKSDENLLLHSVQSSYLCVSLYYTSLDWFNEGKEDGLLHMSLSCSKGSLVMIKVYKFSLHGLMSVYCYIRQQLL